MVKFGFHTHLSEPQATRLAGPQRPRRLAPSIFCLAHGARRAGGGHGLSWRRRGAKVRLDFLSANIRDHTVLLSMPNRSRSTRPDKARWHVPSAFPSSAAVAVAVSGPSRQLLEGCYRKRR